MTMGDSVVKNTAQKVRTLREGNVLVGFAGAVADAFTLFEKLEEKLERFPANVTKAVVELAKDWRMDRYLRRLNALLLVADRDHLFLVSGEGEVIEPDDNVLAIGSGGSYAMAAARKPPRSGFARSIGVPIHAHSVVVFLDSRLTSPTHVSGTLALAHGTLGGFRVVAVS